MAAPINPANGKGLPHSKFTSKEASDIRARIEFKRMRLEKLRLEREAIESEIAELIKTDTTKALPRVWSVKNNYRANKPVSNLF